MARRKKREPEPWADPWTGWWWHSKPVAKSLHILEELGLLVHVTGRTDKTPGFEPFAVKIKRSELTPGSTEPGGLWDGKGNPVVMMPGDTFYVTKRWDLHAVVKEALRRKEAAAAEEEP